MHTFDSEKDDNTATDWIWMRLMPLKSWPLQRRDGYAHVYGGTADCTVTLNDEGYESGHDRSAGYSPPLCGATSDVDDTSYLAYGFWLKRTSKDGKCHLQRGRDLRDRRWVMRRHADGVRPRSCASYGHRDV